MVKNYRELTGEDVLQAGDRYQNPSASRSWFPVNPKWVGQRVCECGTLRFKRKLTAFEITAAERVRFEAWCYSRGNKNNIRLAHGEYADLGMCLEWQAWCAAVNCDPMGDVGNE